MPKNDSIDVTERRIKINKFIVDGLTPKEILHELPTIDIQTIYDDIKFIRRKSVKTMTKLSKDGLAFNYDNMIQGVDLIYSETRNRLREQLKDNTLSNDDFIKLSKLARETITEKRELLKESLSIFEIEKLKLDVKELKEQQQGTGNISFMNQGLPRLTNDSTIIK